MDGAAFSYSGFPHLVEAILPHVPYESLVAWRTVCRDFRDTIDAILAYDLVLSFAINVQSNTDAAMGHCKHQRSSGDNRRLGAHPRFMPAVELPVDTRVDWSFLAGTRYVTIGDETVLWGVMMSYNAFMPLIPQLDGIRAMTFSSLSFITPDWMSFPTPDPQAVPRAFTVLRMDFPPIEARTARAMMYPRGRLGGGVWIVYPKVPRAELVISNSGCADPYPWSPWGSFAVEVPLPACVDEFVVVFTKDLGKSDYIPDPRFVFLLRDLLDDIATALASIVPHIKCSVVGVDQLSQHALAYLSWYGAKPDWQVGLANLVMQNGKTKYGWSESEAKAHAAAITFVSHDQAPP